MSVVVHLPDIDRLASESEHRKRQEEYAMRVAFYCRQYVPLDENTLRASEPLNSKYADGLLIWNTPYAAMQYYVPMNHTTPDTYDHWDEQVRKNHMPDLIAYVDAMYKEG